MKLLKNHALLFLVDHLKQLASLPSYIHKLGYQAAERYMLERLEKMEHSTATQPLLFMIYGLLALGYKKIRLWFKSN